MRQILIKTAEQAQQTDFRKPNIAFRCHDCKRIKPVPQNTCSTGYGYDNDNNIVCFECCSKRDKTDMLASGKATLYLTTNDGKSEITNWPGTLRFKAGFVRKSWHNIASHRYDTWFVGPDGFRWHAVQYGDNTQIVHCRRTKQKVS